MSKFFESEFLASDTGAFTHLKKGFFYIVLISLKGRRMGQCVGKCLSTLLECPFYNPKHPYTWGLLASVPKVNADEHERLVPIEGNPVDLINPPAGCPFAPRCRHCMKACLTKMPPESTIEDGHTVACWLPVKEMMEKEE